MNYFGWAVNELGPGINGISPSLAFCFSFWGTGARVKGRERKEKGRGKGADWVYYTIFHEVV